MHAGMIGGWPGQVQTGRLDPSRTTVERPACSDPSGRARIGRHAALRPPANTWSIGRRPRLACGPIRTSESTDRAGAGHPAVPTLPMMLDDRAKVLLKALIERYIAEGQPVGSRTLSRASGLELS